MTSKNTKRSRRSQSWDGVADWYAGWAGPGGSHYHQTHAIPLMLKMLSLRRGEMLVDLGCGAGALVPAAHAAGARVTGVDLSHKLIRAARAAHGGTARFHVADVTRLRADPHLKPGACDAASFLLSIQDIDPLESAIDSAAWLLRTGGRLGIVMLHPCFRVPRQSGWGWDAKRELRYRRLDSYLSELAVPMQPHADHKGVTRSYHRPLGAYVAALASAGFSLTAFEECADTPPRRARRAERRATAEFPLFLGLAAVRRA